MIGSVSNSGISSAWALQKTNLKTDSADQTDSKIDSIRAAIEAATEEASDSTTSSSTTQSAEQQLASALAAQFDQSRFAPPPPPEKPSQALFDSIDTENTGYITRDSLQAAFDSISDDSEANAESVDQIFQALDADGDNQISQSEFTTGVDAIMEQEGSQSVGMTGAPPPPPPGGMPPSGEQAASSDTIDPADTNQDGTVSLQELLAYQTQNAQEEQQTQQASIDQTDLLKLLAARVEQTYGRFDAETANATLVGNSLTTTA